ncbi:hypothetical protein [Agromyces sp. GXQ0307]|uniref:hypothetical protein n=1 Tax=Agromyces sp. GXQ0307 TaxID=3377835 RepID=UPI00383AE1CA
MTVQTIDVTPTPAQYVNVICHLLTNVYPTEHQHLTRYQLITAWHAVERDARALYSDVGKLPRPLVVELAKLRVAQAAVIPDHPITEATTYAELNAIDPTPELEAIAKAGL